MDEQVVPSFTSSRPAPRRTARVSSSVPEGVEVPPGPRGGGTDCVVPGVQAKKQKVASTTFVSPAPEYPGKLRWQTPLRVGTWKEDWQSARELGLHVAVRSKEQRGVANVVRSAVAEIVVASVGDLLPLATVQKWLCLLCEYLELNADEQVLVVCLLRKYVESGGKFVGEGDWARPQRWECVVAVACYFAVLLTEEFPGRTSMDLRELLGPNFRFGREQIAFLKLVNWRISITAEQFREVKECCIGAWDKVPGQKERLLAWFRIDDAIADRKRRAADAASAAAAAAANAANAAKAAKAAMDSAAVTYKQPINTKKRAYAAIAPADDSMVPRAIAPQYAAAVRQPQYIPQAVIPAVPQWMPHHW